MGSQRSWYYLGEDGVGKGPVSEATLIELLRTGRLSPWVKVRFEGMNAVGFLRADSIPFLAKNMMPPSHQQPAPALQNETPAAPCSLRSAPAPQAPSPQIDRRKGTATRSPIERLALAVGYGVLALLALTLVLWFATDIIWMVLGIGTFIVVAPIVLLLTLMAAAIAGAALALPLRPFLARDHWERVAAVLSLLLLILYGLWLAVS